MTVSNPLVMKNSFDETGHDWEKQNAITLIIMEVGCDIWRCRKCGKKYTRRALHWKPGKKKCPYAAHDHNHGTVSARPVSLNTPTMNIAERLEEAISQAQKRNGMPVWCIYLGRKEESELRIWAEGNNYPLVGHDNEEKVRSVFRNALVYVVDADEHFNVS